MAETSNGYREQAAGPGPARRVRRVAGEQLAFVPFGLVPALGLALVFLFALFPFAQGYVEGVTERTARQALIESGETWAIPKVSGQWVTLEGRPPSEEAAQRALETVRLARTMTLFGSAIPATRVKAGFDGTGEAGAGVGGGALTPDVPGWTFTLRDGVLTLDGEMPSREVRDRVVEAANARRDPPRLMAIEDSLTIINRPVPDGFLQVSLRGVNTVSACDNGITNFTSGVFSLDCELPEEKVGPVRARAIADLSYGKVGAVRFITLEAIETCESSLSELLGDTKIEFDSSSALISTSSSAVLDLVVESIRVCPGTLRIEGHTDSTGLEEANLALSRARADAVRSALIVRGVPPGRLVAEGFGSGRPIASNATASGRARNRRIEIRVVRTPG